MFTFLCFSSYSFIYVFLGVLFATSTVAIVGTFSVIDRKGLMGDALAHALLPGIAMGFLIVGRKDPWILLLSAFGSGALAYGLIDRLLRKTKLKSDAIIASTLSLFFSLGLVLFTWIQRGENRDHAGLHTFLLGQPSSFMRSDFYYFTLLFFAVLLIVVSFLPYLRLYLFDPLYASSVGVPLFVLRTLLKCLLLVAVIMGVETLGVLLMTAMLALPAATARYWTDRLSFQLLYAGLFASSSGGIGVCCSLWYGELPVGPCALLVLMLIAVGSSLFSPKNGFVVHYLRQKRYKNRIDEEHILKYLFEVKNVISSLAELSFIDPKYVMSPKKLHRAVVALLQKGLIKQESTGLVLTLAGRKYAQSVVQKHLLWERYLARHFNLPKQYQHEEAERMEHLLSDEILQDLKRELEERK